MSILFLNILTLLAHTQSADNLFLSFTVLCENENFLISSIHCFFANVTPCPLVLLSSLTDKKIFLSIFSYPFNILSTSIWSPLNFLVFSIVKPHSFRRISLLIFLSFGIILIKQFYLSRGSRDVYGAQLGVRGSGVRLRVRVLDVGVRAVVCDVGPSGGAEDRHAYGQQNDHFAKAGRPLVEKPFSICY